MASTFRMPWLERNLAKILAALLVAALIFGSLVLLLFYLQFGSAPLSGEQSDWAEFGDYVGGVLNSAFAFFALIALALTLRVQSIELKMSTEELRNSAEALAKQNDALARQSVESNIFQLIRLHNDIVSSLDLRRNGNVIAAGRDCFPIFYSRLGIAVQPLIRGDYLDYQVGFLECYQKFFEQNEQNLGHYFRNLYRVYKYINENGAGDRSRFAGILRAQLSSNELVLLYYNGISQYGGKFKPLMEEYALFESINTARLFGLHVDKSAYASRAFGEQPAV